MCSSSRDKFAIAIICTLTLEGKAVEELFDETYNKLGEHYRKGLGDDNAYVNGRIGSITSSFAICLSWGNEVQPAWHQA